MNRNSTVAVSCATTIVVGLCCNVFNNDSQTKFHIVILKLFSPSCCTVVCKPLPRATGTSTSFAAKELGLPGLGSSGFG